MTINAWYSEGIYNIKYDGRTYKRGSYIEAKELIESLLANMTLIGRAA